MSKHIKEFVITKKGAEYLKRVAAGARLIAAIAITVLAANASAQLTEWPTDQIAPCQYLNEWQEKLEWSERKGKENRIQYFWAKQNRPGQKGDCNHLKGLPDSCARVSWVARITSKRDDWRGWGFPDRAQAVYHFEGGVTKEDFCYGAG